MVDTCRSKIDLFSVELWREVFDYFDSNDLWYSFSGLNKKIDAIIDQTILHLNFQKQDSYGYFIENILSTMNVVNIRSLRLREANETKHFFSIVSLNSLVQLRLLSLDFMYSFNDNSFQFWSQLSSLKYLRALKIHFWGNFGPENSIAEKEYIIRSIFNNGFCPLLKSFKINTCGRHRWRSSIPLLMTTSQTTSIKYLSIDSLTLNDFIKLLPALQNVKAFHVDHELSNDTESNEPSKMIIAAPLMPKCIRMHLTLSDDITFEHVEYLLKLTPNLKDLFLWGWCHLLNAKKWELLLSTLCPKLLKLELICTGRIGDDDFDQAAYDFDQECKTTPFWLQRNVKFIDDEEHSGHDYREDITVRFNIKKSKQPIG